MYVNYTPHNRKMHILTVVKILYIGPQSVILCSVILTTNLQSTIKLISIVPNLPNYYNVVLERTLQLPTNLQNPCCYCGLVHRRFNHTYLCKKRSLANASGGMSLAWSSLCHVWASVPTIPFAAMKMQAPLINKRLDFMLCP